MGDARNYNITVRFAEFGGQHCYEARVKELPDLTEYADTVEEAYELALDAIQTTAEIMAEKGKSIPAPEQPEEHYSGRVTLRLPKSLHRSLAEKADDEGVSLNHMLVTVLSMFRGFDAALEDDREEWLTLAEHATPNPSLQRGNVLHMQRYDDQQAANWG